MAKATITKSGAAANVPVFVQLYPLGTQAFGPSGNPVPHTAYTQADGTGAYTLYLEETDTMSPAGMAWEITEVGQAPVYIQFGSGGGAVGSLGVSAPTSVGSPFALAGDIAADLVAGTGLALSGTGPATIAAAGNLLALAGKYGGLLFDKVHITGKTAKTAGGIGAWVAPAACVVFPGLCGLNVTTIATGTCNVDAGYTAANATTLNDTLLDGATGHVLGWYQQAALGTPPAEVVAGTNENPASFVAASGKWITLSSEDSSSDPTGMVADFYVAYMLL